MPTTGVGKFEASQDYKLGKELRFRSVYIIIIIIIIVCILNVWAHICHNAGMEITGQPFTVCSLLLFLMWIDLRLVWLYQLNTQSVDFLGFMKQVHLPRPTCQSDVENPLLKPFPGDSGLCQLTIKFTQHPSVENGSAHSEYGLCLKYFHIMKS